MTDIGLSAPHSTPCSSRHEFLICPLMLQKCAFRYFWPYRPEEGAVVVGAVAGRIEVIVDQFIGPRVQWEIPCLLALA